MQILKNLYYETFFKKNCPSLPQKILLNCLNYQTLFIDFKKSKNTIIIKGYVNYLKKLHFLLHILRINKSNFYRNKKLFKINNTDVNKILVYKRKSYGKKISFKYFIGHDDNDDSRPLCINLSQMIGYAKHFESNKAMSFKVIDKNC